MRVKTWKKTVWTHRTLKTNPVKQALCTTTSRKESLKNGPIQEVESILKCKLFRYIRDFLGLWSHIFNVTPNQPAYITHNLDVSYTWAGQICQETLSFWMFFFNCTFTEGTISGWNCYGTPHLAVQTVLGKRWGKTHLAHVMPALSCYLQVARHRNSPVCLIL